MAETKNTEKQNIEIQKEEEKRESVRKADAAVKSMHDFTSPEVLYQELRHIRIRNVNPVNLISFILSVLQSSLRILSWIRRP